MEKTEIRMHNGKLLTPVRIDSNTYVLVSPERVTPNFAEDGKIGPSEAASSHHSGEDLITIN